MLRLVIISIISLVSSAALAAQTATEIAPGGPGQDAHWPSAAKKGFGTANTLASKVWFTLNDGVMTEVFYPTLDVPNVQTLQLVVVKGSNIETESEDTVHRIEVLDPQALSFRQVNTAENGTYTITKTYVTDPERSSVLVDVDFRWNETGPNHVSTAFLAMGDRASANRALDYLFNVQQKADGSFPQNSWVDGRAIGGGLQMDQVAFPIILAYRLERNDRKTWLKHIKPAADFILSRGPRTEQERWEEKQGYSPSTIAAEIAGLVCAAHIASLNRDRFSAGRYLKNADEWAHNVDRWTRTTIGPQSDQSYYLRITDDEDPNDGARIEINSGGGTYDEREIVDAGFLELVRLGIKPPTDPSVIDSLAVVDKLIKIQTPHGSAWYRYNHDAYGERPDGGPYDGRTGVGRLWALLTGERGEYELARGNRVGARQHLDTMMRFANEGMMLPEQIWDRRESPRADLRFGAGTGSATPLAWSMAQFIRLAINLQIGHNSDTPAIVAARYAKRPGAR